MATFWERAIVCSLCLLTHCTHFAFQGGTLVLIASVPGYAYFFYLLTYMLCNSFEEILQNLSK